MTDPNEMNRTRQGVEEGAGRARDASQSSRLAVTGNLDRTQRYTELQMPDGRVVQLPTALLIDAASAEFLQQEELAGGRAGLVIPLVEETLVVGKRTVATGTVRLYKTVQEYEQTLNEPLAVRTYDVERIVINRPVDTAPAVRQEGDVTIYPLIEERLILTKELILKEEVRVTKRDTERRDQQVVTLRREHLEVERTSRDGGTRSGRTKSGGTEGVERKGTGTTGGETKVIETKVIETKGGGMK